ncbi:PEP-CTERM sorting domain-containing protein [Salipiger sp.]|uniref:PEP-CTERM sorting domain-containing protein n=1 Tax=Salipiger sp. TaxID=2078585 RepID=UPI003A982BC3
MKFAISGLALGAAIAMGGCAAQAATVLVGSSAGFAGERDALFETLTALGHTYTTTYSAAVDIAISVSGHSVARNALIPYIQVGDWGDGNISDSYVSIPDGSAITVNVTGPSALLSHVDASWSSRGFHANDYGASDFIGYATSIPGLAEIVHGGNTYSNTFAVDDDNIYFGWNVYGALADANDIQLFSNAINYLTGDAITAVQTSTVPLPATLPLLLGGFALMGAAARRRRARA